MIPVDTAARNRALDSEVIDDLGMPALLLMELAGRGVADAVHDRWPKATVAILCGSGNNGGDGFVVARWLSLWGHDVRVWTPRPAKSPESATNLALLQGRVPCSVELGPVLAGADVVVDAMLGTGQREAPRDSAAEGLTGMSRVPIRVAVDVPTGINADNGQVLWPDLSPLSMTVMLGRRKLGMYCAPGHHLSGELLCVDIGLNLAASGAAAVAWLLQAQDIASWLPGERPDAAKWNRGHVAVRAGAGAAVLAAHGAFRAGAGMVTLLVPRPRWPELHGMWPEVILAEPQTLDARRHDALVIGPGLGTSLEAGNEIEALWQGFENPVLADADALTIIASRDLGAVEGRVRLITPHVAEAGRLLGHSTAAIAADRPSAARSLARFGTALLKGPCSLISGEQLWINPTGDVALATAGSGDILAGLAGGYLARGLTPARALAVAAWRHGLAGEAVEVGATASDLLAVLR